MQVLIIFCHPSRTSYSFQALEYLKASLIKEKIAVEISDLYAIDFKTDMTEAEYERAALGKTDLALSPDILKEQEKINRADCIIFLYPVWWSDCPAKLKGWFDRVFALGYAYGDIAAVQKMPLIKCGLAICAAGYTNDQLMKTGIAQSMQTIMLEDRLGKRFEQKEMLLLGGTIGQKEITTEHCKQLEESVQKIKKHCASQ